MSDLQPTQSLPSIEPEPAPPPVAKPTLAGQIIAEMQDIRKHQEITEANVVVYWGGLSFQVSRLQSLVLALIGVVAFLAALVLASVILAAFLVGHVR